MSIPDEIKRQYEALSALPADADRNAKRRRGFDFERLLNALFLVDGLEPRTGYRPKGEQIDGSIYLDGRIYLLEAKWHSDPLPASTLYQFKGKVDGKLAGTIGVFISNSGYADDAIDALVLGKALNIILLDQRDMDAAIIRGNGFKNVLKLKLRKAAEEGAIYYPTEAELVTADKSETVEIDYLRYDQSTGDVVTIRPATPAPADLLIVCEGDSDRVAISVLAERILSAAGSTRSIKIIVAMGKVTIPRVANAFWSTFQSRSKALIVVDGDNELERTAAMLADGLQFNDWIAAIPNPSIENWLDIDRQTLRRFNNKSRFERYKSAAAALDLDALRKRDQEFAKFYDAILGT